MEDQEQDEQEEQAVQEAGRKLVGAAKASHEKKNKGKKLLPYPFPGDTSLNENAQIRMIKMVIPNCPADPRPEIVLKDGTSIPNPRYTGEPNCQTAYQIHNYGRWDVEKCESLGHDPWHTTFRKKVVEDVVDERPVLEDGETPNPDYGYVIKERVRVKVEKRLNIIQVSDNARHTSNMEVPLALARGCRFLEDFGIESPCEFRGCVRPKQVKTRFGEFCSERHARLVGADKKKMSLPVGGDPVTQDQALEEREEMLDSIAIGIK